MLLYIKRAVRAKAGAEERSALEKGIAEAQASMAMARGSEHADLRATLTAFIAQYEKRIAEIRALKGR
jgi:predicted component of type VI protein secretion system